MSIIAALKKQGGKATAQTISEALPDLTKELPAPTAADAGKMFGLTPDENGAWTLVEITPTVNEVPVDVNPGGSV